MELLSKLRALNFKDKFLIVFSFGCLVLCITEGANITNIQFGSLKSYGNDALLNRALK